MITVVIKPRTWEWLSPGAIQLLKSHAIDLDVKRIFQGEPQPKEKDGKIENQEDIDKYARGWRRIEYGAEVEVPFDALTRFLPCEVVTLHREVAVDQVEQRVAPVMNTQVKVVVPGPALQSYDEVQVQVDCCTDALQNELNHGWRILAICVQPDQRRPDYILGRCSEMEAEARKRPPITTPNRDIPRPLPPPIPHALEVTAPAADPTPPAPSTESAATPDDDIPF